MTKSGRYDDRGRTYDFHRDREEPPPRSKVHYAPTPTKANNEAAHASTRKAREQRAEINWDSAIDRFKSMLREVYDDDD